MSASARHPRFVRLTHWLTAVAVLLLLWSGIEVVISHPRFYWGETGNVNMVPLFSLPVPASRGTVPTGYAYSLTDQNGWSRNLHFQAAWLLLFTGLAYLWEGVRSRHFRTRLFPAKAHRSWRALAASVADHVRMRAQEFADPRSYNLLQRLSYLIVVFVLVPLVVWTGLAMAPAFTAVFPASVTALGGRQSARTLHFAATIALVAFTVVHVVMLVAAGFRTRMRAMVTGNLEEAS